MIKNIFAGKWEFNAPILPSAMTQDQFASKWPQVRGQAGTWWSKLGDDDLDQVAGKFELFMGLLQRKYGYTRASAEKEFNKRLAKYESQASNQRVAEYAAHQNSKQDAG